MALLRLGLFGWLFCLAFALHAESTFPTLTGA